LIAFAYCHRAEELNGFSLRCRGWVVEYLKTNPQRLSLCGTKNTNQKFIIMEELDEM
jgi:hypothetical protein